MAEQPIADDVMVADDPSTEIDTSAFELLDAGGDHKVEGSYDASQIQVLDDFLGGLLAGLLPAGREHIMAIAIDHFGNASCMSG